MRVAGPSPACILTEGAPRLCITVEGVAVAPVGGAPVSANPHSTPQESHVTDRANRPKTLPCNCPGLVSPSWMEGLAWSEMASGCWNLSPVGHHEAAQA